MIWNDEQFFQAHPDRQARIRFPDPHDECHKEFHMLGDHPRHRRRILLYKVPKDNIYYDSKNPQILKIPFLAFSSETIEDRDDILLPIIYTIMAEQLPAAGNA